MSNKASKGSAFEREVSKRLSLWWTQDEKPPRDDVFWRSSQSGGRATERWKKGKNTFGSHGDIAAVDPIGAPLIKAFTIECKRGSTVGIPGPLMDARDTKAVRPFESAINQVIRSAGSAGSLGWMIIGKRNAGQAMVYMDHVSFMGLALSKRILLEAPVARYVLRVNQEGRANPLRIVFVAFRFESFLKFVSPQEIIQKTKH